MTEPVPSGRPEGEEPEATPHLLRKKPENVAVATILAALTLGGGGGFFSYKELSNQLTTQNARLEALQALLAEVKAKLGILEAAGYEARLRDLERTSAERGAHLQAAEERLRRLEERR